MWREEERCKIERSERKNKKDRARDKRGGGWVDVEYCLSEGASEGRKENERKGRRGKEKGGESKSINHS